jgi:hypothetical protein
LTGNASTATALAADPADCSANQFANAINASGTLTCAALVLAGAQFANQGTTVTVPHGNAGGNPSWAVVTPADAAGNTSGSGNFCLVTNCVMVTPTLGVASATTIKTDNGTVSAPSHSFTSHTDSGMWATATSLVFGYSGTAYFAAESNGIGGLSLHSGIQFGFSSTSDPTLTPDTILTRKGAANWRFGTVDAATAVAQVTSVQDVAAGTAGNVAGADWTIQGSAGVGSGGGGSVIFQTAIAHGSDTVKDTQTTALTLTNKQEGTFSGYLESDTNNVALTADWTCGTGGTVSSCTAATIIGSGGGVPLTFTLPLVARSWTWECNGVVGQATAVTANSWNFLTATNGATNVTANYSMNTAATATAGGALTDQAAITTTVVIAPTWTLGAIGTKMPFHVWGRIETASASGTVLSLQLVAPTIGDLVTIYRGTGCRVF